MLLASYLIGIVVISGLVQCLMLTCFKF